jgi:hypothetical protein
MAVSPSGYGARPVAVGSKDRDREAYYRQNYDQNINQTGAAGSALMGGFQSGIAEDPRASFQGSMHSAFDQFKERFGEGLQDLRGQQVAMGRMRTGFATEDEDHLWRGHTRDLNNTLADRAMQAEGLNQQRLGMMGAYGDRFSERAMDAGAGEYQSMRAQRLQNNADKKRGWGNLIGAGLVAAGTLAGGPIGGALAAGASSFIRNR